MKSEPWTWNSDGWTANGNPDSSYDVPLTRYRLNDTQSFWKIPATENLSGQAAASALRDAGLNVRTAYQDVGRGAARRRRYLGSAQIAADNGKGGTGQMTVNLTIDGSLDYTADSDYMAAVLHLLPAFMSEVHKGEYLAEALDGQV